MKSLNQDSVGYLGLIVLAQVQLGDLCFDSLFDWVSKVIRTHNESPSLNELLIVDSSYSLKRIESLLILALNELGVEIPKFQDLQLLLAKKIAFMILNKEILAKVGCFKIFQIAQKTGVPDMLVEFYALWHEIGDEDVLVGGLDVKEIDILNAAEHLLEMDQPTN